MRSQAILRLAEPVAKDGTAFARLLDQAQEGWYRAALGGRASDALAEAFNRPNNEYSHQFVTLAEIEGGVVGMVSGYSGRTHSGFTHELGGSLVGLARHRFATMSRISRRVFTFTNTVAQEDFYIRAIAVEAAHRGRGIGTLLLDAAEELAQDQECERLALDVYARNRAGRRLYERFGMHAEGASRPWFGIPDTNLIRMVKVL